LPKLSDGKPGGKNRKEKIQVEGDYNNFLESLQNEQHREQKNKDKAGKNYIQKT
jgi:hypothetical protein